MILAKVVGTVVTTISHRDYKNRRLLVVQPLNKRLEPVGGLQVAADTVDAGPGDLCVMVRSREASLALPEVKFVPVDLALVGVVDELVVEPDERFSFTLKPGFNQFT